MRFVNAFVLGIAVALEKLGIRCSRCGSWKSLVVTRRKLKYGTNAGGILLMDPYWLTISERTCVVCSQVMKSRLKGLAPA